MKLIYNCDDKVLNTEKKNIYVTDKLHKIIYEVPEKFYENKEEYNDEVAFRIMDIVALFNEKAKTSKEDIVYLRPYLFHFNEKVDMIIDGYKLVAKTYNERKNSFLISLASEE
jgi:transcriptional regulator